ncbi:prepilin-type N-terminal cleavage/methylation domain-containing protein [Vibrio hannami]|uniref:PilW family protein n=1 Tax=Vibrio hannami TaxID=2717094 RepID=UPI0024109F2F|nr:prepilin-type N-terminal cleavage/methylation domain-containing protein [Vibrio hannami]MDG3084789.1 prepilin-type N-terminal cleavage/methylation domain-containing protein [Vibrio hannami]
MNSRGFTLVEMVMTIIITGIIVLGITGYIELGFRGYTDTIDRQYVQNQARFTIEKMSREVRHGVPNSFALSSGDKCLSFYPIKYSGFYTQDELNGTVQFIADNQGNTVTFSAGDRIVINPSQSADLSVTSDASSSVEDCATSCSVTSAGVYTIDDDFPSYSIANRHYIYNSNNQVTYCVSSGVVTREQNGTTFTVADSLDDTESSFGYEPASLQRGGLIHMSLTFTNDGEVSNYKHDVQVLNVP